MEQIDTYKKELKAKSPAELQELFKSEQAKYYDEQRLKAEQRERELFFHEPKATANINHWSKASYWTLEEALALSFGKNPAVVKWEDVKSYTLVSPFAKQYELRRDLVQRAKVCNQLSDPTYPAPFLAWAKRNDFSIPEQLIHQIEARGIQVADWKDLYDKQKELYDNLAQSYQKLANKLEKSDEHQNQSSALDKCSSWLVFKNKAERAIEDFPSWKKTQRKIQKTGNLQEWLTTTIGANPREAESIKKFLSDFYGNIK